MHCFKTQMETGSLKETSISFLLVDKDKGKLLAEKFVLEDFHLVSFFKAEGLSCSKKKPKQQRF